MRNALAQELYEQAREDERIVVLVADISPAGAMEDFRREFPERFINVGVAEQAMIGLAAGLVQRGFKPFCYTIATFALFRAYEFIRCDLAYQNLPVTIVGMGAGLSYPTLGGTHQATEDVAVAMACPNLAVLVPCDPKRTRGCVQWCARREAGGPVYLRIGKAGEPNLEMSSPSIGLPSLLRSRGTKNTIVVSYGPIASEALVLADAIEADMAVVVQLMGWGNDGICEEFFRDYARVIVVEEASGAPLARQLSASRDGAGVVSACLPRGFSYAHGTREELLAAAGLTSGRMLSNLKEVSR